MSTFVEIGPDEYDRAAFKGFRPSAAGFEIANARALMWFSQLAYKTHRTPTIEAVSRCRTLSLSSLSSNTRPA